MLIERGPQQMEPINFDQLLEIIKGSLRNLLFDPATEEEIKQLEIETGIKLPPSYRKFLNLTDGAVLYESEELYGTKDAEDEVQIGISRVRSSILDLPKHLIPFHFSNTHHYFDSSVGLEGEYPVVSWNNNEKVQKPISQSFPAWLKEHVIDEYESTKNK